MGDCVKEVANQSAMQVQNIKQSLNEWKYVIAKVDAALNTVDPIKSASAHAGLYTTLYVIMIVANPSLLTMLSVICALAVISDTFIGKVNDKLFAAQEFTSAMDARYHSFCETLVNKYAKWVSMTGCALRMKARSPYRFLTYSLPFFAFTAYLGKKMSIATICWISLMLECAVKIPQVQQQYQMVANKVNSIVQKSSEKKE